MNWLKKLLILQLILFVGISCSSKKTDEGDPEVAIEDEVSDELLDENVDGEVVVDESSIEAVDESEVEVSEIIAEESSPRYESNQNIEVNGSDIRTHIVKQGETLMLIAWNLYGDYSKWRQLAELNSANINGVGRLTVGSQLKYYAPKEEFRWNPKGNPYLILRGDTLGRISDKVYGTDKKWRSIWNNNKPLIKDPNLIFAGFTIYYLPDGSVAYAE